MRDKNSCKTMIQWLDLHAEESVILTMLAYMVLSLNVEVFRRYLLGQSSPYTEEIARFLLIWIVFIGIPYGIRWNRHVIIDFIPDTIKPGLNLILQFISNTVFSLFLIFFAGVTWHILQYMFTRQIITDALEIPKWTIMAAIPLGCGLGVFRIIQATVLTVRDFHQREAA